MIAAPSSFSHTTQTDMFHSVTAPIGANPITIESGKIARLADGAATVRCGETIILVTAVSARNNVPNRSRDGAAIASSLRVNRCHGGAFGRTSPDRPAGSSAIVRRPAPWPP